MRLSSIYSKIIDKKKGFLSIAGNYTLKKNRCQRQRSGVIEKIF